MKRKYATELLELPQTYSSCLATDVEAFADVLLGTGPMVFVGSGGALAAATLAADLHMASTGALGVAMTPLEASTARLDPDVGLVVFTARGRHPDASMAIEAARRQGCSHLGVVTGREREELPAPLAALDVRVATVSTSQDGFLATNSALGMATMVCLAHGANLPSELPLADVVGTLIPRKNIVAIAAPQLSCVAVDLESRLAETGIAAVQVTDFRNLAHGRHVGLVRNERETTLVPIFDGRSERLARRTEELLPDSMDVLRLMSRLEWPASAIDLLVQSMHVVAAVGRSEGVDPGRPGVAGFGRRLYHLPTRRLLPPNAPDPVERKLRLASGPSREEVELAYQAWTTQLEQSRIDAIVLDYDGTCCPTWDRFQPPPPPVQIELCRLLESGMQVGFATGRGKSLLDDTRSWLPKSLWSGVTVGLYNGSLLLPLAEDPGENSRCDGVLAEVADRLEGDALTSNLMIERRRTQISVAAGANWRTGPELLPVVKAVLARPPHLPCKVVASGHSVDIIEVGSGKAAVLEVLHDVVDGNILAIGDQGQVDGNDFELLAHTPFSLSVDRCSADLSRCWNLDTRGESGPTSLVRYLKSLRLSDTAGRFRWGKS